MLQPGKEKEKERRPSSPDPPRGSKGFFLFFSYY
jgi:hypothetical protein